MPRFRTATALILIASPAFADCATSDIRLLQVDWKRDGEYIKTVGELQNACAEPTSPELRLTFRNSAGKVIDVKEHLPSSTANIPPNTRWAFSFLDRVEGDATSIDVTVGDVHRYR